jgi:hypothetical protein
MNVEDLENYQTMREKKVMLAQLNDRNGRKKVQWNCYS